MSESFMTRTVGAVSGILKPLGLYKVNDAYLAPVNDKLSAAAQEADAVEQDAHACGEILDAINADDIEKAVGLALEFFEIDDEVAELNDIRSKVKAGEILPAAVAAKNGPALIQEMVRSIGSHLEEAYGRTERLLQTLVETADLATSKVKELPDAIGGWSLAERLGTPEAVQNTAQKVREAEEQVRELKGELESLVKRVGEIRA